MCGLIIGAFTVFTENFFKKPTFFVPQSEKFMWGEGVS